ncbi:STAS domain-containing protein [Micromonospora peucetia]|uniref:Anti-anti-sigma factor n=1 Tax=Micromonospora peucetia TaxID=47871 RepID=A0A1C6VXS3_9ACTN|nr:STAS domain-containing protein [Micromonospora peucetia]WSA31485.1 STAS domain-containing protein [Micromonospora peucetia]SCL71022.1 anti-anti-sigma factor [Micromonospora peucetia]
MTVVPDEHLMTLICDSCGETTTGTACVLPDAEVVWTLVADHGWSGSPFATGPHRCPRCSLPVPGVGGGSAGRGGQPAGGVPGRAGADGRVDVAVVTTTGDTDVDTADELRAALRQAVDVRGHVVVDLTRVHLIDADGLGLLVRAHRDARDRGAVLCLAAPSRFIRTVLHTMRLDGLFPIFASPEEAVRRLSSGGTGDASGLAAVAAGPDPRGLPPAAVTEALSR